MNLSKSKYCNGIQCKKMLWLDKHKPSAKEELNNKNVFDNGTEVGELAKRLFGTYTNIDFNEDLSVMIEDTNKALEKDVITITEASFNYNNNFCSVDILKKFGDNYEIYEVKSSTELKDVYLDDVSYQFYVLENLGYNVTKACIVHINSNYVRHGNLDLHELFTIEEVTDISISKQQEIEKNIHDINEYMKQNKEPEQLLGTQCVSPYDCPFFKFCSRDLEKPNVFDLKRMRSSTKFKLYQEGKYKFTDLIDSDIDKLFKEQIDFEINRRLPKILPEEIREFLNTLSYPLYFLDFETYQEPIPEYDDVKPYMQIPFQYSLHYMPNENELKHTDYLADPDTDPRRGLAEQLVKDIPENTCVVAYNMMFEKMVIKNLANIYPDLSEHLMNIYDNMKDLMIPFKNRQYYVKEMEGSYSIKYVLPALFPNDPSLNYKNLDLVHNGQEAQTSFIEMRKMNKKEKDEMRNNLLKYCGLDTYAMVKIYEKLKEVTKD